LAFDFNLAAFCAVDLSAADHDARLAAFHFDGEVVLFSAS
jgi:hypothetical protein